MIPQVVQLIIEGADGRHLVLTIALLLDQLLADGRRTESGIEPLCAEAGIGLALGIDKGFDVLQQMRQASLGS
jgi:hypothetical protein